MERLYSLRGRDRRLDRKNQISGLVSRRCAA